MKSKVFASFLFVIAVTLPTYGQSRWQRIISGEGFVMEVDSTSLILEPNGILSARFRTVLSKAESLPNDAKIKYKTRIETIEFDSGKYRVIKSELFDSDDVTVAKSEPGARATWRRSVGATASRLFAVTAQLPPFGDWKVNAYRYVGGEKPSIDEPIDLMQLVGNDVRITLTSMTVGKQTCASPVYQTEMTTIKGLSERLGSSSDIFGNLTDPVQTTKISCGSNEWKPPNTLLIRQDENRSDLLWNGVLLELSAVREKGFWIPLLTH